MPFDFGAVLLVPFPFTIQTVSKKRPAVVDSSLGYNSSKPDVVVMAVTNQLRAGASLGDVWVDYWQAAGLLKPSAINPVFATLKQGLIVRRLGALAAKDRQSLRQAID